MKNTGMSVNGWLQNLVREFPDTPRLCVIDVGTSMRTSLVMGKTRDAAIAEYLESALGTQENCVSTTIHKRTD
ncbi:MAG: hypothetical protein M0Z50_17085 [Planctomycetia bacterium]|jgi:hypothetical protein|nr:hypothetical protein [Planctomycetia bacterium]